MNTHSEEETKPEDFGLDSPITVAEVAGAVKQLYQESTPGVDAFVNTALSFL